MFCPDVKKKGSVCNDFLTYAVFSLFELNPGVFSASVCPVKAEEHTAIISYTPVRDGFDPELQEMNQTCYGDVVQLT